VRDRSGRRETDVPSRGPTRTVLSRRSFLGTIGTGVAALTVDTPGLLAGTLPRVPTRALGRTGVQVPMLGAGMDFDTSYSEIVMREALRHGVNYWDTSPSYVNGNSEAGIGRFFDLFPGERGRVFLVTKSDSRDAGGLEGSLTGSLSRMRTSYVDLYLLNEVNDPSVLDLEETRGWAERAKASGRIRFVGFSTHNAEPCLSKAAETRWLDVAMFRYNFRLFDDLGLSKAIDRCRQAGIGLASMKFRGLGPMGRDTAHLRLLQLAGNRPDAVDRIKLKAVWMDERVSCVLVKMMDVATLRAYVEAAASTPIGAEEKRAIEEYARETRFEYCDGCGQRCEPAAGVPVADVMRWLMYDRGYGESEKSRELFRSVSEETRRRMASADFSEAERNCPRRLPIGRLLAEASRELV
jgi:predicted aldo/keto reductase-like oxidoreductase